MKRKPIALRMKIKMIDFKKLKLLIAKIIFLVVFLTLNNSSIALANVVGMYLSPSTQTVAQGDFFNVEIALNNPSASVFDTLSVWLTFNPFYLEVQDTDAGNWIATGVNILDEPYHSVYAFNFHLANNADNTAGEIVYTENILGASLTSSGTFARITFRALNITPSASIDFDFNWGSNKDTAVMLGGEDVLGSSSNHTDGAIGGSVSVVPEPGSLALLGAGLMSMMGLKMGKTKGF